MESTAQSVADLFNDAQALEKVLKLLQACAQIVGGMQVFRGEVERWDAARGQIAISRRFFRLFKWVDCWNRAHREYEAGPLYPHLLPSSASTGSVAARASAKDYTAVSGEKAWPTANEIRSRLDETTDDSGSLEDTGAEAAVQGRGKDGDEVYTMLAVLKWSLLGLYFLMEMWTITDAMALTSIWQRFGINMQEEALKMWVYGIAGSIVLGLYELFTLSYPIDEATKPSRSKGVVDEKAVSGDRVVTAGAPGSSTRGKEGRDEEEENEQSSERAVASKERRRIVKQLVIDCCDILIPSSAVGWIPLDTSAVGMAGAVSASVSLSGMWVKAARRS